MSSDGSSDEDIPGLESVSSSEVGSEMAVPLSDLILFFFWPTIIVTFCACAENCLASAVLEALQQA